ncbi:MAG: hypothetical protein ABID54_06565, partial [Pseudomonadota bacterium]
LKGASSSLPPPNFEDYGKTATYTSLLEFPEFSVNPFVSGRNLLPQWGPIEGERASAVSSAERKGKASPKRLEGESIPHLGTRKGSLRKQ